MAFSSVRGSDEDWASADLTVVANTARYPSGPFFTAQPREAPSPTCAVMELRGTPILLLFLISFGQQTTTQA
jgi:hypothetical protein